MEWAQLSIHRGTELAWAVTPKGSLGSLVSSFLGPRAPAAPPGLIEGEGKRVSQDRESPPPGGGGFLQGVIKFKNRLGTLVSAPTWSAYTEVKISK